MREEVNNGNTTSSLERITPAHAGRIFILMKYILVIQDHPRACGKNILYLIKHLLEPGSPPRMREEYYGKSYGHTEFGITPAHAGRIWTGRSICHYGWDHPRACGKNPLQCRRLSAKRGSPPRMREESRSDCVVLAIRRITPAHAGRIFR